MKTTVEFPSEIAHMLRDFADAVGTSRSRVIRTAVMQHIEATLRDNAGLRERYTKLQEIKPKARSRPVLSIVNEERERG